MDLLLQTGCSIAQLPQGGEKRTGLTPGDLGKVLLLQVAERGIKVGKPLTERAAQGGLDHSLGHR